MASGRPGWAALPPFFFASAANTDKDSQKHRRCIKVENRTFALTPTAKANPRTVMARHSSGRISEAATAFRAVAINTAPPFDPGRAGSVLEESVRVNRFTVVMGCA